MPTRDHHPLQNGGHPSGPGLAQGSSPSPVRDLSRISVDGQSPPSKHEDLELVNNWNDSEADGPSHDEGNDDQRDTDSDSAQGYIVESEVSREETSPSKATRAKTRATRKSKRS